MSEGLATVGVVLVLTLLVLWELYLRRSGKSHEGAHWAIIGDPARHHHRQSHQRD